MQWKVIALTSVALFLSAQVLGLLYGLSLGWWVESSTDIPQTLEGVRLARRTTVAITAFAIYSFFFRRIAARIFAHAASVFLVVELLNALLELIATRSVSGLPDWKYSSAHFVVLAIALLASLPFRRGGSKADAGIRQSSY